VPRRTAASASRVALGRRQHDREHRWTAMAMDELRQIETPLSHGDTAKAAIDGIARSTLDA
jgi:hypothetical protein